LLSDPAPVRLRQQPDLLHLAPKPLGLAYEKPGQQIPAQLCVHPATLRHRNRHVKAPTGPRSSGFEPLHRAVRLIHEQGAPRIGGPRLGTEVNERD
jgi:hypothetical protein